MIDTQKLASRLALEVSSWPIPSLLEYAVTTLKLEGFSGIEVADWSAEDLLSYVYDRYADELGSMEVEDLQDLAFRLVEEGTVSLSVLKGDKDDEH